jgi:hypothetical protein
VSPDPLATVETVKSKAREMIFIRNAAIKPRTIVFSNIICLPGT